MTRTIARWIPLTALAFAATLAACGSSTPSATTSAPVSTPTSAATSAAATPTASAASASCPTGATVGSALGTTLPDAAGGGQQIPGAAASLVCNYHTSTENVIIEVLNNINPSIITQFSAHFLGTVKSVSGLGDKATSFYDPIGTGKDNEGVVATKGSTLVSIAATATPASLSQVEALVNSLL